MLAARSGDVIVAAEDYRASATPAALPGRQGKQTVLPLSKDGLLSVVLSDRAVQESHGKIKYLLKVMMDQMLECHRVRAALIFRQNGVAINTIASISFSTGIVTSSC